MCFAEKVRESKSHIEGRLPPMDHFVIEKDQFALIQERILWAEVSMNQTDLVKQRFSRQRLEKAGGCG